MARSWLAGMVCALAASVAEAGPVFVDRAPGYDFTHEYTGGWEHFVGGGVAVLDCNGDRFPDLYVAGGAAPARLLVNRTEGPGMPVVFSDETPPELALDGVTGAYPLDLDGDGRQDLAVMRVGRNALLAGGEDCRFDDASAALGFDGGARWTTAFSATWEPGARLPTLAFGNYVDRDDPEGPFGACDDNDLYRPGAAGYGPPTEMAPGFCALSMLFSDWARRGRQDLRISNDRHYYVRGGYEQLWRLDPEPRPFTEADGWDKVSIWGMGIASRDLNGDGLTDVYLTSMGDQLLQLRASDEAGPVWRDAPFAMGATAHRPYVGDDGRPSTGWHAQFGDVDNDGRDDLFVAKGNVDQMTENASEDPNNLLMRQPDGSFAEAGEAAGLASVRRGRGAAVVDLNLDGRLDVVVVNRRAPLEVCENVTEDTGNWLEVEVAHAGVNTALVGGWVEIRSGDRLWSREITVGGGHAGGQSGFHHFGLGDLESVEMRLIAPDGSAAPWQSVGGNGFVRAVLDGGAAPSMTVEPLDVMP